jgi:hypothetical protein
VGIHERIEIDTIATPDCQWAMQQKRSSLFHLKRTTCAMDAGDVISASVTSADAAVA